MNGILLVDKPVGWTSHDVVAKARTLLRQSASQQSIVNSQNGLTTIDKRQATPSAKLKVGHTGTLDPFATGLLILVIGSYTKRAGEFSGMDKTYEAEMILGTVSSTGDTEGELTGYRGKDIGDSKEPSEEALEAVFSQFKGDIMQMPHKYSAKKVDGQKAYDLARAGKEVKLEPKQVTIHNLQITSYEYPSVKFTAKVSSGTYIRSLAEDIGTKLGTGAYLLALRRTSVGKYKVEDAKQIDKLYLL